MGYLVITYNLSKGEFLKVGYKRISSPYYTYLSRYLYPYESPYSIGDISDGSYNVELTVIKDSCGDTCGVPSVYIASTVPSSIIDGGNEGSTSTTTSTSTTSSSTTTTTTTIVPMSVSWDSFTSDPGAPQSATLTQQFGIISGSNYTILTSQTSGLLYYIIREPSTEPVKITWYNTDINQGTIPDQVWQAPLLSGLYRYYKSNGSIAFSANSDTTFKS